MSLVFGWLFWRAIGGVPVGPAAGLALGIAVVLLGVGSYLAYPPLDAIPSPPDLGPGFEIAAGSLAISACLYVIGGQRHASRVRIGPGAAAGIAYCPRCGSRNDSNCDSCPACGAELARLKEWIRSVPSTDVVENDKSQFCPGCNSINDTNWMDYCWNCGREFY